MWWMTGKSWFCAEKILNVGDNNDSALSFEFSKNPLIKQLLIIRFSSETNKQTNKKSVDAGHDFSTSPTKSNKVEVSSVQSIPVMPLASKNVKDLRQSPGYSNVDIFTYEETRLATKQFRPDLILGEGGFGIVYKGSIDESVRPGYQIVQVAIKELNREGFQGDREWLVCASYLEFSLISTFVLVKTLGDPLDVKGNSFTRFSYLHIRSVRFRPCQM